jgi:hypothetical protein
VVVPEAQPDPAYPTGGAASGRAGRIWSPAEPLFATLADTFLVARQPTTHGVGCPRWSHRSLRSGRRRGRARDEPCARLALGQTRCGELLRLVGGPQRLRGLPSGVGRGGELPRRRPRGCWLGQSRLRGRRFRYGTLRERGRRLPGGQRRCRLRRRCRLCRLRGLSRLGRLGVYSLLLGLLDVLLGLLLRLLPRAFGKVGALGSLGRLGRLSLLSGRSPRGLLSSVLGSVGARGSLGARGGLLGGLGPRLRAVSSDRVGRRVVGQLRLRRGLWLRPHWRLPRDVGPHRGRHAKPRVQLGPARSLALRGLGLARCGLTGVRLGADRSRRAGRRGLRRGRSGRSGRACCRLLRTGLLGVVSVSRVPVHGHRAVRLEPGRSDLLEYRRRLRQIPPLGDGRLGRPSRRGLCDGSRR